MNYFQLYSLYPDDKVIAAWESQVTVAKEAPWLKEALAKRESELFPRFAVCYADLRALPRSARRALQRQLARSRELTVIVPEWLQGGARRGLQHKLARSLAGAALLLALGQGVAQADTINVTTKVPAINAADGKCSLIEAIVNANDDAATHGDCTAGSGADTIVLPKATHTLTDVNNGTYGDTGLPVITSEITIEGNGAKIIRKKDAPDFRLIAVASTGDLTLQNVTLSGGDVYNGSGGGVYNLGTLTIENSTISKNTAYFDGGGVANGYGEGTVTIKNSTITGNKASGSYSSGGGVYNGGGTLTIENSTISKNTASDAGGVANDSGGTVTIKNSSITGNKATYDGGGVYSGFGGGTLTIENSTISKNTAFFGGGVYNYNGTLTIKNSTITGNKATYAGGGVDNIGGTVTIKDSTITGNKASGSYSSGGGVDNFGGTLNIENSTISKNTASAGGGVANDGDYYIGYGTVTIKNSTITGNKASGYVGGGVYNNYGCDLTIENSTITGNKADYGGGVYNAINGTLTLNRSLISGNKADEGPEIDNGGTVTANNFNLFGANGNAGVTGFAPGATDIVPGPGVTVSKILGPLKNNGGPTKTHALKPGSPAIDAIPSLDPGCTGKDQRGVDRPQDGDGDTIARCDVGAFEGPP